MPESIKNCYIVIDYYANALSDSIREFQKRAKYGGAKLNYDFFDEALKQYNKNEKLSPTQRRGIFRAVGGYLIDLSVI